MSERLMVLPAADIEQIRLVELPDDFEGREAYRFVTGVIAEVEEDDPDGGWESVATALEDHGFRVVAFQLGPSLD